jgi:hypothetical protein
MWMAWSVEIYATLKVALIKSVLPEPSEGCKHMRHTQRILIRSVRPEPVERGMDLVCCFYEFLRSPITTNGSFNQRF